MSRVSKTQHKILLGLVVGMILLSMIVPVSFLPKAMAQTAETINGAGSTFVFPLMDTWRVKYSNIHPEISLNYQSIGSGAGINQFTAETVDFGATDAPLSATQTKALPGPAVHIPESIGSIVIAYNIPGFNQKGLKLTGSIIADIYLGKVWNWNDPEIASLNPGVPLPSHQINVYHRADGSGTTYVFTKYLSSQSAQWNSTVGYGTAVQWPVGRGATGNQGVASAAISAAYSIAYVEIAYALQNHMNYAFIQNSAGNFIEPTLASTQSAVSAAVAAHPLPMGNQSWSNVSLLNADSPDSYPIASFTYLVLYQDMSTNPKMTLDKAKAIVNFVSWIVTDGQQYSQALSFVPLPKSVVQVDQQTLASLTFKGQPLLGQTQTPQPQPAPQPSSPPPQPSPQPLTLTSSLDGNSYTITGTSTGVQFTSFTINPHQSVRIQVQGKGDVILTLPKTMIDHITSVMAEGQQINYNIKSSDQSSTTIAFTVPDNTNSVDVMGTMVVPEFGPVVLLLVTIPIAVIVLYGRYRTTKSGMVGIPG